MIFYSWQYYTAIRMQPFPDISNATTFPLAESSWLEFKETFSKCVRVKVRETIYGLLNNGGGYVVVGVRDIDRYILGIDIDKNTDVFQLRVDDIYHQELITKKDCLPIDIGSITSDIMSAGDNKKVLVITVKPEPNTTYMMKDGTQWYRLNASNYRLTTDSELFTEEQVELKLKAVVKANRIEC